MGARLYIQVCVHRHHCSRTSCWLFAIRESAFKQFTAPLRDRFLVLFVSAATEIVYACLLVCVLDILIRGRRRRGRFESMRKGAGLIRPAIDHLAASAAAEEPETHTHTHLYSNSRNPSGSLALLLRACTASQNNTEFPASRPATLNTYNTTIQA